MQVVNNRRGAGGTVVELVPAPDLAHGTAHTVGKLVQRTTIDQHTFLDRLNNGAVNKSICCFLRSLSERLLANGHKVFLLTGQRALNLEEVGQRKVLIVEVRHVPLHLHLRLDASDGGGRQSVGRMDHGQILLSRLDVLYIIIGFVLAHLLVTGDDAEFVMRHGSIELDDTAVLAYVHRYRDNLIVDIGVFVANTGDIIRCQEPGYFDHTLVLGRKHGIRGDGLQSLTCRRHGDVLGFGERQRHFLTVVTIT